jgi:hypothetical protein
MIRTTYVGILADITFNQHHRIVNLQKLHGVDIGYHQDNAMSVKRMLNSISNMMHRDLITEINAPNLPISLMADSTTDSTNNHLLIVYMFFLRNNSSVIQLYRLIKIGFSENSEPLYNLLIDAFKKDKIDGYLRRNLIAFITDG